MNYVSGKKFIDGVEVEGITVIDGVEVEIQDNAPSPFIYGVKNIVTSVYHIDGVDEDTCDIYNVILGTYAYGQPFKGYDWLNEDPFINEQVSLLSLEESILELKKQTIDKDIL